MTEKKLDTLVASQSKADGNSGLGSALFAGFGTLLILMAIISIDSLHTLEAFENHNSSDSARFCSIAKIRSNRFEPACTSRATFMSDYAVIESDPHSQERLRTEFQSIRDETTASLKACIQSLPAEKREPFQHLAEELDRYWSRGRSHFRITCDGEEGIRSFCTE